MNTNDIISKAIQLHNESIKSKNEEITKEKSYDKIDINSETVNNITDLLSLTNLILPYKLKTINKDERFLNACVILKEVAKIYNGDITLNWNDINIYKYIPYKVFSGGGWVVGTSPGWRTGLYGSAYFYYKSDKLSELSYNNFKQYWEDYWMI